MLHGLLFHRLLPYTQVIDVDLDVCKLTFPKLDDPKIEETVEKGVKEGYRYLELQDSGFVEIKVLLGKIGKEKGSKSTFGSLYHGMMPWRRDEEGNQHIWEEWKLKISLCSPKTDQGIYKLTHSLGRKNEYAGKFGATITSLSVEYWSNSD